MLKPSAHVFREMSICPRSRIGSGACDEAGTQTDRPTGGCCGVNRRYGYWLYDAGPPATISHDAMGEDTEIDSSSHTCLFNGTQNLEQTGSEKTTLPSTPLKPQTSVGPQTLKLHCSSSAASAVMDGGWHVTPVHPCRANTHKQKVRAWKTLDSVTDRNLQRHTRTHKQSSYCLDT